MAEITSVDHDHLIDSGLSPAYRLSGMLNAPACLEKRYLYLHDQSTTLDL